MKKVVSLTIFLLIIAFLVSTWLQKSSPTRPLKQFIVGEIYSTQNSRTNDVQYLGNPTLSHYTNSSTNEIIARNVWDMQVFNSRIYIGAGDYDTNMGCVPLIYYDYQNNCFVEEALLPEEQISNFKIIDEQLVIPGIDAISSQSHEWANWYIHSQTSLRTYHNLPNAAHCFDMIEYDGAIFAGLGGTKRQIARSVDNGNTFELIPTYRNGKETDAFRIYDLFILNDNLYAFNGTISIPDTYIYNADSNSFEFCNTPLGLINIWMQQSCIENGGVPFAEKLLFKNHMIFVNETLTFTDNMQDFEKLTLAPNTKILDTISKNNTLYLLSGTKIDESQWQVSVYSTSNLKNWNEVLYFYAPTYARSFELVNDTFFFGLGSDYNEASSHNGEILRIDI